MIHLLARGLMGVVLLGTLMQLACGRSPLRPGQREPRSDGCLPQRLPSSAELLDLFILLDQSGSMDAGGTFSDCSIGESADGSRWCNATTALYGFFVDPGSEGMGVAYSEFNNSGCEPFASMDVPLGIIGGDFQGDEHLARLYEALTDDEPQAATATEGAVRTLTDQTHSYSPESERQAVAILITDGSPTACVDVDAETEALELNGLLVEHFHDRGVPSFIIGMDGADAELLENLAEGAGSRPHSVHCLPMHTVCSYYSVGSGEPEVFTEALNAIRSEAVSCSFVVARKDVEDWPLAGWKLSLVLDEDSTPELLGPVSGIEACTGEDEYWVELPSTGTATVQLCPSTCERRTEDSSVELVLGCSSE